MAEVTPLVRKAVNWISQMRDDPANRLSLPVLIEQASARFNLSPKDTDFVHRFFEEQKRSAGEKA